MLADHILPRQCLCVDILTQPTALDHSRSCLCLSVGQLAACWLLHAFVNARACFSETGHYRNCLSNLWFLPLQLTFFSHVLNHQRLTRKSSSWWGTALIRMIMMSQLVTSSQCARQDNKRGLFSICLAVLATAAAERKECPNIDVSIWLSV